MKSQRIAKWKFAVDGLTLADTAALFDMEYRFMSELENDKKTAALGKVLQLMQDLGLEVEIHSRKWADG